MSKEETTAASKREAVSVERGSRSKIRTMVQIGMLGAIATVLMLFEFPLPFVPPFYKLDFSEVPVLIGTFAMGPLAGAAIELVKVLLNLIINGTTTAGVGEAANFLVGCALVVPAGIIYKRLHSRKGALVGMGTGTIFLTVIGCFLNAFILLPFYAKAFGMPMEALVAIGTELNPAISNVTMFIMLAVAPFNLLKGIVVSVITFVLYKYISPVLRENKM